MSEDVARFNRASSPIGLGGLLSGQARLHVGHFDFEVRVFDFMCFSPSPVFSL